MGGGVGRGGGGGGGLTAGRTWFLYNLERVENNE